MLNAATAARFSSSCLALLSFLWSPSQRSHSLLSDGLFGWPDVSLCVAVSLAHTLDCGRMRPSSTRRCLEAERSPCRYCWHASFFLLSLKTSFHFIPMCSRCAGSGPPLAMLSRSSHVCLTVSMLITPRYLAPTSAGTAQLVKRKEPCGIPFRR